MPEGHEIHRFAERHKLAFAGRKVHVESPNGGFADAEALDGRKLLEVIAMGKHLGYKFGKDLTLHVHLGQYGDFWEGTMPYPEPKGALRLRMSNKTHWLELRGPTDCSIFSDEDWAKLEARIGPDPLHTDADPQAAYETIARKKTPIGVLLMDQSVVSGIGNIYRAELLYRVRLNPDRPGKDIPAATLKRIWRDAVALMKDGMEDRRMVTTLARDRPHRTGKALDEETHYVYRRQGKPCRICATEIASKPMAGAPSIGAPYASPRKGNNDAYDLAQAYGSIREAHRQRTPHDGSTAAKGLLRHARREEDRDLGRDPEGLPQARPQVPPGCQSERQKG